MQIVLYLLIYNFGSRIFNHDCLNSIAVYIGVFLIDKQMMSTQSWQTLGDTINSIQTNSFSPWWTMMKDLTYSLRYKFYEDFKVLYSSNLILTTIL